MISSRTTDAQDDAQAAAIARASILGPLNDKLVRRKAIASFKGKLRRSTRTADEQAEYVAAYVAAWSLGLAAREQAAQANEPAEDPNVVNDEPNSRGWMQFVTDSITADAELPNNRPLPNQHRMIRIIHILCLSNKGKQATGAGGKHHASGNGSGRQGSDYANR